ncbi:MAG TPA: substrate-binding domain-containing protein, partial [Chloroflexota bacterium]|nr:substrate-binding domain-containing protein [Chloroflexota bacterium]
MWFQRSGLPLTVVALGGALLCSALLPAQAAARARAAPIQLIGAGSTFDAPFFGRAFAAYSKMQPVSVTYRTIGSAGGIDAFINNSVDFGATDVPMNKTELAQAVLKGSDVVQLPIALGGIAITYNL